MADWYYSQGNDQKGPVPEEKLRDLIASGEVTARDSAWRQGMGDWQEIAAIPELAGSVRGGEPQRRESRDDYDRGGRDVRRSRDDDDRGRGYDDDRDYDVRRRPRSRQRKVTFFAILMIAGAGLWFVNFFLPWWGISMRIPSPDGADPAALGRASQRMIEIMRSNDAWLDSHISLTKQEAMKREFQRMGMERRGGSAGVTLLGFNTGTGLFAFIVSIVILGFVITSLFVGILAAWRWTGAFLFAVLAIVLLIFGMLWLFGAPEADAPPILSQGKIIGPYVHLVGTLAVLAGGVLEGIFGLLAFLRSLKQRPA